MYFILLIYFISNLWKFHRITPSILRLGMVFVQKSSILDQSGVFSHNASYEDLSK